MASDRDNFPEKVIRTLQERAGNRCSNQNCACVTSGPHTNPDKASRIGVAAHITAAAKNGPRFDPTLSTEERSSIQNGIWLCQSCSRLIDVDPENYPVAVLQQWRQNTEDQARQEIEGCSLASIPKAENLGWICPHCKSIVPDDATVCIGCQAEIFYGLTTAQRQGNAYLGAMIGGAPALYLMYEFPILLNENFGTHLSRGFNLDVYSILPVGICALATAFAVVKYTDNKQRKKPPTFIRAYRS